MKNFFGTARWLPGLAVTVVCFLAAGSAPFTFVDGAAYDMAAKFTGGRQADDSLVIVAIDPPSLRQLGPWPWPRDRFAQLVDRLAGAQAGVIGFALPFDTPENWHGLEYLRHLQKELNAEGPVLGALDRAEAGLDTDGALGRSARKAGNVVFAMPFRSAHSSQTTDLPPLDVTVTPFVLRNIVVGRPLWLDFVPSVLTPSAAAADRLFPPVPAIAQGAAAIGHLDSLPPGGSLRAVPLVLQYGERYFPSFSLLLAAHSRKLERTDLKVESAQGVSLQEVTYRTDPALRVYPRFYRARDDKTPFKRYSFAEVYAGQVEDVAFRGKTVLIGLTAPALVDAVDTPIGEAMAPVVATAHVVSSLLNDDLFTVPTWAVEGQIAALLLVGLYLMLVLPHFRVSTGLALSLVLLFLLINAQFMLLATQSLWVPLMVPAVALAIGVAVLSLRRLAEDRFQSMHVELEQATRSLGQMLQSQGQLDLAFEKFRRCTVDESLQEILYNLGLDFERKRQFGRAVGVFTHILRHAPGFRDTRDRIRLNLEMEKMTALGKGFASSGSGDKTLAMSYGKLQQPMLGRYQVEREIGRGAMGMVYLGRDPRIGRTVAIKTMALMQEFDADQLDEVRARFYREAETAGRLNHPNIVTVYDVGEEQDLAYMAMDYLQGKPLSAWCRFENLLPAEKVFDIMICVAEALDYAHQQHVVHRDVKPANIMYDEKTGVVKVTDFGVAFLMDASKTKTGTVLGSPSYMSPEQLAGQKVDGRSDLFSLGVTFFQLLTGELPFVADSLASLMYKIANDKHVDVRILRPDLPACVSTIINRTLYKDIEKRVQTGHHLANALRRCKRQITKEH